MIREYGAGFWEVKSCIIYVFTVKQMLEKCWEASTTRGGNCEEQYVMCQNSGISWDLISGEARLEEYDLMLPLSISSIIPLP